MIIVAVALQLDAAAPVLAALKEPIVIAKVNADKFTRLAVKYDIEYGSIAFYFYPTLKVVRLLIFVWYFDMEFFLAF